MLQNIRNNIQGTAAKIIIAIIIVPFAFFGVESLFQTNSVKPAAEVNGEEIPEAELAQSVAMQKRRMIGMMGEEIDPAMLEDAVLRRPALDMLIKQQLMLQAAETAGIVISNEQLNRTIASMPQFQDNGRFSQARYEQILRTQGYSGAMFKQLLKSDLTIQQLSSGVAGSAFITQAQLGRIAELLHEARDYHYIPVPVAKFEEGLKLDEAEIEAYYQASPQQFQSPEKVKLSYLELTQAQFHQAVSDEQVEAEYQRIVASAERDAEREAAHILLEISDQRSREEAAAQLAELKQKLEDGAEFADLAARYSEDPGSAGQGGQLGFSSGDSFPAEFEDSLASLTEGEVSEIVETDAGLHLIKLLSIRQPEVPSLEEARQDITERLRSQDAKPRLVAAVEDLRDLVFNSEDLLLPAEKLELTVQKTDWLSRDAEFDLWDGAERLRRAAFDEALREQGLNSEVFELSPERYVVIHVEDYAAPETLPLAEVRSEIESALRASKAKRLALARAEEIQQALRNDKAAEEVAKQHELRWEAVLQSKRSASGVDAAIRAKAFSLPQPEDSPSVGIVDDGEEFVVVQVIDVAAGDLSSMSEDVRQQTRAAVLDRQMSQGFSAYFNALWSRADIEIN